MCGGNQEPCSTTSSTATVATRSGCYHLRGHVLPEGSIRDVYVVDGRITFERLPDAETMVEHGWLLPGLVDSHAHLALASPAPSDATPEERVTASARAQLAAGVLLVREPGSEDHQSRDLGPAKGLPRTVTAGRFLAPPGGYFPGLAREVSPGGLALAVAEEAAAGTGWVKLVGDYPDAAGRLTRNWSAADLAVASESAHQAGARITIHAMLPATLGDAVAAGFDAIEHGTGMPRDLVPVLAERGIAWVPTLLISEGIRQWAAGGMAVSQLSTIDRWLTELPGTVAAAARAGVRLLAGTDAGMVPHGMVAREVSCFVAAGVPAASAVAAGSWDAREYLGFPGIVEGAPGDLIALEADPRRDPQALTRLVAMVLDGREVSRPRTPTPV